MTLNDLFLNARNTSLDAIIHQTAVQTEQDKEEYAKAGYQIQLTEAEFREKFPAVDPSHICYSPSVSLDCFYFNKCTLAVAPFHMGLLLLNAQPVVTIEGTCAAIAKAEDEAAHKDFTSGIRVLPDRMRMEYFEQVVARHGSSVADLYELFMDLYVESDFGCNELHPATLGAVVAAKTDEDRKHTEEAIAADKRLQEEPYITIYRGGNSESKHYSEAYSWTLDINIANFFACRLGNGPAYIAVGRIKKEDIIEVLADRGESEVLVYPQKVHITQVNPLLGTDYLGSALPEVAFTYLHYRDRMHKIDFTRESEDHGKAHCARVLLLTQLIAHRLDLPLADRKILAEAAIYHDCRRTHDGDDTVHGGDAARYYHENEMDHHPIVEFLCKYHCLPDEEGYAYIEANEDLRNHGTERVRQLYQIFKDADALDRVRFDIRALDLDQLRLPVSKIMTLVARINFEQIRLPV